VCEKAIEKAKVEEKTRERRDTSRAVQCVIHVELYNPSYISCSTISCSTNQCMHAQERIE